MSHQAKNSRKLRTRLLLLAVLMTAFALTYTQPRKAEARLACQWMYQMDCNPAGYLIKNCDGTFTNTAGCLSPGTKAGACEPCP